MKFTIISSTVVILTSLFFSIVASSPTPSARVHVRIEGLHNTIFEGNVVTRAHDVDPPTVGRFRCDGTNNNANPTPGPTFTAALDDTAKEHGFTWDGNPWPQFDDIFITTIAGEANNTEQFWGLLLNYQFTPVGGCQQEIKTGDGLLFAFDAFSKNHFLKLAGPRFVKVHKEATLIVTDGMTGKPVSGADVDGKFSGADGRVTVSFEQKGFHKVKADKSDSIRSNSLEILVT